MRQIFRSVVVLIVAVLGAVAIGIASTITAAITLAATALIVPGTGTPNANIVDNYMENARDYYMTTTPCTVNNCNLVGIDYPASFWPLPFPGWCEPGRCETWDDSVEAGRAALDEKLTPFLGTEEEVVIFGYSQGGAVVANELRVLATLDPDLTENISVVTIGNIDNPVGGLLSLLGFLGHVPILDVTTGLSTPVDTGIPMTTIGFQYDPVVGSPLYWGNVLALLNALVAFDTVHGNYLEPNGNDPTGSLAYGYTPEELADQLDCGDHPGNCRTDDFDNTYITIPAKTLPISDLVLDLADSTGTTALVKPFVDLFTPTVRVLIDTAYDPNANPGVPRYLSIIRSIRSSILSSWLWISLLQWERASRPS